MTTKIPVPTGVSADELANFCASLEEVEQSANGYGVLRNAVIESEFDGTVVVGTYDETNRWTVTFKAGAR